VGVGGPRRARRRSPRGPRGLAHRRSRPHRPLGHGGAHGDRKPPGRWPCASATARRVGRPRAWQPGSPPGPGGPEAPWPQGGARGRARRVGCLGVRRPGGWGWCTPRDRRRGRGATRAAALVQDAVVDRQRDGRQRAAWLGGGGRQGHPVALAPGPGGGLAARDGRGAEPGGPWPRGLWWPPRVPEAVWRRRVGWLPGAADAGGGRAVGEVWATRPCRVSPWCGSGASGLWHCPIWLWSCARGGGWRFMESCTAGGVRSHASGPQGSAHKREAV
jgi:hypothetical protein